MRVLYRVLTVVLLALTVIAVALALRGQDWPVLAAALHGRRPGFFAVMAGLAALANSAAVLAAMLAWWALLSGVGAPVPAADAARIFGVGQFTKYLPGKVFGVVVSVHMGRAVGVPAARMVYAWLLTLVVGLLTGATVGLAAGPALLGASTAWLALAALPIVAVLVRPALIGRVAAVVARLRRRVSSPGRVSSPDGSGESGEPGGIPARAVRRAVAVQLLSWFAGGVHLWLLAVALGAPPARSFALCVGAFGLGTVAGVFAVFAPEGLGVREVVLLAALGAVLPLPVAGVVALVSRLVVAVSELATAGFVLLVTGLRPRIRQGRAGYRVRRGDARATAGIGDHP